MNQNQKILLFCTEQHSQNEILKHLGWTQGATSSVIKRLIERKLLKKIERGIYKTTKSGIDHLAEYFTKERIYLDSILAEIFTNIIFLIKDTNKELSPEKDEKQLTEEIKKIFFGSVINNHESTKFTLSIWQAHKKHICNEHGFNFKNAFLKNAKMLKEYTSEEKLFNTIHYIVLPQEEQFKMNPKAFVIFGM